LAQIDLYKEKLYSDFEKYAQDFKSRMESDSGTANPKIIDLNDAEYRAEFPTLTEDELKTYRLKPDFAKPVEYDGLIKGLLGGFVQDGVTYPGFNHLTWAQSTARRQCLNTIFTSGGLARYLESQDEWDASHPGEPYVDHLIIPPNKKYSRTEEANRVAQAIYFSKLADLRAWFIDTYRWEYRYYISDPDFSTADRKKWNTDTEKAYRDALDELKTEYGTYDPTASSFTPKLDFVNRFNILHWNYVVNEAYSLDLALGKNYFTELVEGDRVLRRTRTLESLFDVASDGKYTDLKQIHKDELWKKILKTRDDLVEFSKTWVASNTGKTELDYYDKIFKYEDPQVFYTAIQSIFPVYTVLKKEATGQMVPFFKWSPAVLLVRDLLIHLIFEGDDKTINKYLRISSTSEPRSEEKPKKGFFK
jgi:hypothetical protein